MSATSCPTSLAMEYSITGPPLVTSPAPSPSPSPPTPAPSPSPTFSIRCGLLGECSRWIGFKCSPFDQKNCNAFAAWCSCSPPCSLYPRRGGQRNLPLNYNINVWDITSLQKISQNFTGNNDKIELTIPAASVQTSTLTIPALNNRRALFR